MRGEDGLKVILQHFDIKRERLDLQHGEWNQREPKFAPTIRSLVQPTKGEKVLGSLVQVK